MYKSKILRRTSVYLTFFPNPGVVEFFCKIFLCWLMVLLMVAMLFLVLEHMSVILDKLENYVTIRNKMCWRLGFSQMAIQDEHLRTNHNAQWINGSILCWYVGLMRKGFVTLQNWSDSLARSVTNFSPQYRIKEKWTLIRRKGGGEKS